MHACMGKSNSIQMEWSSLNCWYTRGPFYRKSYFCLPNTFLIWISKVWFHPFIPPCSAVGDSGGATGEATSSPQDLIMLHGVYIILDKNNVYPMQHNQVLRRASSLSCCSSRVSNCTAWGNEGSQDSTLLFSPYPENWLNL